MSSRAIAQALPKESTPVCPGLFYATPARDGIISRIRIPGGILNSTQGHVVAEFAESFGEGYVHVTNRANLQIRQAEAILPSVLTTLQKAKLAAPRSEVDHLRNIMASPTAGIDALELMDTRTLVSELDAYICEHPLEGLSPKFSVGFDGGGTVSVYQQKNEITFRAIALSGDWGLGTGDWGLVENNIYFHLILGKPTFIFLKPEQCISVVAALAQVYLDNVDKNLPRKPRLKHLLQDKGVEWYLKQAQSYLPFNLSKLSKSTLTQNINAKSYHHIGVHPQRQPGLSYIGIVLPLGQISSEQLHALGDLASKYGSGTLRLTPWQNLLISDIPNSYILEVKAEIERLGLNWSATDIHSALVACTGKTGCASSATDTKKHALTLSDYLKKHITLDVPVTIHFSGCSKSCAHHGKSDITLLGTLVEKDGILVEGYQIYMGDGEPFGRSLNINITNAELPEKIFRILQLYQIKRTQPSESFGEFANRYTIPQLRQWMEGDRQC